MSIDGSIRVGAELPPIIREPSTRDLVRFAHGSNDSAPLHFDKDYARSRGFESVIVHGSLKGAYMAQVLTDWVGDRGWVSELRCEYRAADPPWEPLIARGTIETIDTDGDETRVAVALRVENARGEITSRGRGVVVFS